jgi:hypothetical protein
MAAPTTATCTIRIVIAKTNAASPSYATPRNWRIGRIGTVMPSST